MRPVDSVRILLRMRALQMLVRAQRLDPETGSGPQRKTFCRQSGKLIPNPGGEQPIQVLIPNARVSDTHKTSHRGD